MPSGRVYCGRCWAEFESGAQMEASLPPPKATEQVTQPLLSRALMSHGALSTSATGHMMGETQNHVDLTVHEAVRCERHPAHLCRGRVGADLLWQDETGKAIYCGSCWADFEAQGFAEPLGTLSAANVPEGWTIIPSRSRQGLYYWFNPYTGASQFEPPCAA